MKNKVSKAVVEALIARGYKVKRAAQGMWIYRSPGVPADATTIRFQRYMA